MVVPPFRSAWVFGSIPARGSWGVIGRAWGWVVLSQPHWWAGSLGGGREGGAGAELCRYDDYGGPWRVSAS